MCGSTASSPAACPGRSRPPGSSSPSSRLPPPSRSRTDLQELRGGRLSDIADDRLEDAFLSAFRGVAPRDATFLGGESVGSLLDRVLPALERLCANSWDTALAVLHGGVNRAILSWALAGEPTFFGHLEQSPACINIIDAGPDWVVRAVNVTPEDPAHLGPRSTTIEQLLEQHRPYRRARQAPGHGGRSGG